MSLTARHVTLLGSGAAGAIGLKSNAVALGHAGASASVDARDVIIRGYGIALSRTASQNSDGLGTASRNRCANSRICPPVTPCTCRPTLSSTAAPAPWFWQPAASRSAFTTRQRRRRKRR